jgi:hypothetical protein
MPPMTPSNSGYSPGIAARQATIVSETVVTRYKRRFLGAWVDGDYERGLDLLMSDGTLWFHPFDGGTPRQVTKIGLL